MMLTGNWPFKLEEVAAYVAEDVPLPSLCPQLLGLSSSAQDFITICLHPDFAKRPYPSDLLKHPFLESTKFVMPTTGCEKIGKQFKHFANLSAVRRAALTAAVRHLKAFEVEELRRQFEFFDAD